MPATDSGYVYQAEFANADELVTRCQSLFKAESRVLARNVAEVKFAACNGDAAAQWMQEWEEGQVFNAQAELRWRRQREQLSVLLLTEDEQSLEDWHCVEGAPYNVVIPATNDAHGFLLWGTRLSNERWWEARIPHPLHYAGFPKKDRGEKTPPPQLTYKLYQDRMSEMTRWVRFVHLVEVN